VFLSPLLSAALKRNFAAIEEDTPTFLDLGFNCVPWLCASLLADAEIRNFSLTP
jgi:hypothetical protein